MGNIDTIDSVTRIGNDEALPIHFLMGQKYDYWVTSCGVVLNSRIVLAYHRESRVVSTSI